MTSDMSGIAVAKLVGVYGVQPKQELQYVLNCLVNNENSRGRGGGEHTLLVSMQINP